MGLFVDLDKLKRALRIPPGVTMHDALLGDIIGDIDGDILAHLRDNCGLSQGMTTATYSEKIDVEDGITDAVMLDAWPVRSVIAVTNGTVVVAEANRYHEKNGVLRLVPRGAYFQYGNQTVWPTYTAGFDAAPADLKRAGQYEAIAQYNTGGSQGFESERIGKYAYKLASGTAAMMSPVAQRILASYTRVFP